MAENPLLPHRKLRELHAHMLRCRELERKQSPGRGAREALLAATTAQLQPGDLLSTDLDDVRAATLAPAAAKQGKTSSLLSAPGTLSRLAVCAGAATGLQAAGIEGLVLTIAHAGAAEPGWQAALEWAHGQQLPLLLACADAGFRPRAGKRGEPLMEFGAMQRLAQRSRLPVLTVDGEDAVAVYRVMQEAALRARHGGGPAVLWATISPLRAGAKLPRASQPIVRLEKYLATRGIALTP